MPDLLFPVIAALAISLYYPLSRRRALHFWKSRLDRKVPFVPAFVLAYVCLYPLMVIAFVALYPTAFASQFYVAATIAALSAAAFWYMVPTGFHRPHHLRRTFARGILKGIYDEECNANAFPSSHVYISFLCAYYLGLAFPAVALLVWCLAILVMISTVLVRQHELIDILGGIAWALAAIILAPYLLLPL
jgi:membrane-associated phospholipid phosphatase